MIKKSIPSLMTITSFAFGILSIISAFNHDFGKATFLIILGMLLDGLDGRVARALHVSGNFGKELDSLADVVSFGVAPCMILYESEFYMYGTFGILFTLLFPICGILRLARFNTNGYKISRYFVGLPITAAGGILAVISLFHTVFHPIFLGLFVILLSFLMISTIKYPNFKKVAIPKSTYYVAPLMFLIIFLLSKLFPKHFHMIILLPLICFFIFIGLLIYNQWTHSKKMFMFEEDEQEENHKID